MKKSSKLSEELTDLIEKITKKAKELDCPEDQIINFLTRKYIPLNWQWQFHKLAREADKDEGPVKIGIGGARGPGKSHAVFSQVTLDDCQRIPKLKALFLRQTGKAARESFEDLLLRVLVGKIKFSYNKANNVLSFPNNSKVILGGFQDEKDIDQYIGIEYDLIAVEELTQLTQDKVDKLLGSMRTSKSEWRPRLYASFNPGGIGHQFVKKVFIQPFYENQQKETRFVPANYKDNPYLNKEYVSYLENLTGALGKAWREGSWDIFEGQYFAEWSREKHTTPPFPIPETWKRFRAYDHGRENPACCLWFALDYNGRCWCYRELYVTGQNVDQISQEINRLSGNEIYQYSIAGRDIFAKTGYVGKWGEETLAQTFARHGITFLPASIRRVDGWNMVHQYLNWNEHQSPKLIFFNTCYNVIRTFPALIHDDIKPEDLNTKGEDHAQDATRYFLMSLHEQKTKAPLSEVEKKIQKMKEEKFSLDSLYSGKLYRDSF